MHRYNFNPSGRAAGIFVLVFLIASGGCTSSKIIYSEPRKITGVVMLVGNEPFTTPALRTSGGKVYLIRCSDDVRRVLLVHQGEKVDLFYNEIDTKESGDEIYVVRAVVHLQ